MEIGLIDVDSRIPNLALMKISAWHKSINNAVSFYSPIFRYDEIYVSKIFTFSRCPPLPDNCIKGGSGFDISITLPDEIERVYPDYSIFNCDYAIGFITRGCTNKCKFCIVPQKEGKLKKVAEISSFWKNQKRIKLLDNNLTASPDCIEIIKDLKKTGASIDFSQGLDLRLITPKITKELVQIKLWKQIHFAWDNILQEKKIFEGLDILVQGGVKKYKIMVYVLIGFDSTPEEDYYRVIKLKEYGIDSFVMPYDKTNEYQSTFTRWVNHKAIFKKIPWCEYRKGYKKIKCPSYEGFNF